MLSVADLGFVAVAGGGARQQIPGDVKSNNLVN